MMIFSKNDYTFYCESQGTRYGFRHLCHVFKNGVHVADSKCCYYNRTWERFTFQSVLNKACSALGVAPFETEQG